MSARFTVIMSVGALALLGATLLMSRTRRKAKTSSTPVVGAILHSEPATPAPPIVNDDVSTTKRRVTPAEAYDQAAGPSTAKHGDGHLVAFIEGQQRAYRGPSSHYLVSWTLFQHGTVATLHWVPRYDAETQKMVHDARRPLKMAAINAYMRERIAAFVPTAAAVTPIGDITDFAFETAQTSDDPYSIDYASDEPHFEVHVLCRTPPDMSPAEATDDALYCLGRDSITPIVVHTSHAVQRPDLMALLHAFTPLSNPLVATIYDYVEAA